MNYATLTRTAQYKWERQFQQYFTDGQSSVIHEEKNSCNQNAVDNQLVSLLDKRIESFFLATG
jgi:hypothetical protein